ncbi:unnamed protein product [Gongylonema pulchrum]|uniref:BMERB domain-containing protein n=1 Tax=Gongylonema pulchrum TaxID=637853 RepID=A0A183D5S9_9BILA|nr:unnamed protein product [Gongylonema pulchrum]
MQKAEKMEKREDAIPTPTLEMLEEKQLLAACTALREDIARHKSEIIALDRCLRAIIEENPKALRKEVMDEDYDENYWLEECRKEEKKRSELLAEIISLRNDCCQLRAQIELNSVKRPSLLVTRF